MPSIQKKCQNSSKNGAFRAFTLVEMLVVVAIIGILMIVALPAYNNYSTKSKFSEVMLATAPTKTAISACAVSGDCISGNAITLNSGSAGSQGVNLTGGQLAVFGNLYAFANTIDAEAGVSPTQEALSLVQAGYGIVEGGPFCFNNSSLFCVAVPNGQPDLPAGHMFLTPSQIITGQVGAPTTNAQIMAALNGGAASSNLPCVGPSSTNCSPPTKYVASVSYDNTGVITATAQTTSGLNGETFVLSPNYSGGRVDWAPSGTCQTRAGGALC